MALFLRVSRLDICPRVVGLGKKSEGGRSKQYCRLKAFKDGGGAFTHLGRNVSGVAQDDGRVAWSFERKRGLEI